MNSTKTKHLIVYLILILMAFIMILPFIWTILTSFKTQDEALKIPPQILPDSWSFRNYKAVCDVLPFATFFLNTFLMVLFRVLGSVFFSALAAYAFARLEFPFKNFLFMLVLLQMMVPSQIFILPQYMIVSKLGWLNTVKALVLPGVVSTFGTFLLRQVFMGIPK